MKRMICFMLFAFLLTGMVACSETAPKAQSNPAEAEQTTYVSGQLNVGFCMVDITPRESTPMQGYGSSMHRLSNDVEYALKGTIMAVTGANGETALLIETDLCTTSDSFVTMARLMISEATGLPESQIYIGASHTHAAPDMSSTAVDAVVSYTTEMLQALKDGACKALDDRMPATLYLGSSETEGLNFVRNYTNYSKDGTPLYWGDNFMYGTTADATTTHRSEADPTLYVMKVSRDGRKDIILMNYRAHPHLDNNSSTYALSADFVGALREAVTLSLDAEFMYIQGASGNINTYSKISSENRTTECPEYARLMMTYIQQALESAKALTGDTVQVKQTIYQGEVNHSMDSLVTRAKEVSSVWSLNRNLDEAMAIADKYGFHSPFHANAVGNRSRMAQYENVELNVIVIGDQLAIGTIPGELFDTLGMMLEAESPYENVLLMGYTGSHQGYIPDLATFEQGSYEADISKFVPGTGEKMILELVKMMNEIKNAG